MRQETSLRSYKITTAGEEYLRLNMITALYMTIGPSPKKKNAFLSLILKYFTKQLVKASFSSP